MSGLLDDHRLVTIVGPAGVGKTRLAIELARAHPAAEGAWLVRLDTATTPEGIPQAVGEALRPHQPDRGAVLERLGVSELLLVLDNCEHLVEAVAD